jgi:uncharacterized protein (TIGR03790 family)
MRSMAYRVLRSILSLLALVLVGTAAFAAPRLLLPRTGFVPDELAIVINDADPRSRQTGDYYRAARRIPESNVIRISFPPGRSALPAPEFAAIREQIIKATPEHVQAYAIAWTQPYRVGCMSLTSALALGFDPAYCSGSCGPTRPVAYFNSPSRVPARDHGLRPAMLLAGDSEADVRRLIDRGIAADSSFPAGTAYLVSTGDAARNVRAAYFERTIASLRAFLPVEIHAGNALADRQDVLAYFTGLPQVPDLSTLRFLPGALADHLTSFGGQLTDSSQMSALRWLQAGATASYGTVIEPCNHPQKFPFPAVALFHYANGASAIEAYWKSVAWPGEGVFVGEPLARPFAPQLRELPGGQYELQLISPGLGQVILEHATSPMGPYRRLTKAYPIHPGRNIVRIAVPELEGYVRLNW